MEQYHWRDCPADVRSQVDNFTQQIRALFGANLIGVYLHGSLAMGCFNPHRSDLDLLMLLHTGMDSPAKQAMANLVLAASAHPCPIEISILTLAQVHPWRYPTPFEFHFSESHRVQFERGNWIFPVSIDPDLAAHVTITHERGICLYGLPIVQAFPDVPPRDYQDSIFLDFEDARNHIDEYPVYAILNMCRVYWYLLEKVISSKAEAGIWAMDYLPEAYQPAVRQALAVYRGEQDKIEMDDHALRNVATYLTLRVHQIVMIEKRQHGSR